VLQNLVGTHHCPTFVHVARLPPLPLATFVRATRLPSTSSTCVLTHCKTSLLPTAVLHWYVLLVWRLHRRSAFVRVAEPRRYARLSYIRICYGSAAISAGYIHTYSSSAINIVDLRSYALQNLVGTHRCRTFVHAAHLLPLLLATFIRAPRLPSTSSTCVRMRCRTSLVHTAVLHSYTLHVCRHYCWLHSYALLLCRQHRRPAFVRVAKPRCYPLLSYIGTCCSSAIFIIDLRSYALLKLVGIHCFPTFVRAARMQSTPLTCIRTRCRISLVHTAVLHSYMLHVCHHYRWLHSYALLVCCQHRRPAFVRVAKPRCYPLLSYICTCCSSADYMVDLRSYALQNLVGTHCCPTFVHATRLPPLPLATFVRAPRLPSTSSTCVRTHCRTSSVHMAVLCPTFVHAARLPPLPLATFVRAPRLPSTSSTCICTHCRTSLVHTAVVHSYTLYVCHHYRWLPTCVLLVCCLHRRPAFVCVAEASWYPQLSYIRTRCSYAVNTADLSSYALQNLVGTHCCPTFVHAARLPPFPLATFVCAARLPSISSTCVRTHCKTSLLPTAVLHWYLLLVWRLHCRPAFVRIAEPRRYARLSYICTCCASAAITAGYIRTCSSSAVNIVDLRSYTLQNLVGTHRCHTFVHVARLPSLPLATFVCTAGRPSTSSTCVRTRCKTSLLPTAVLHSYVLLVCSLHHRPAFVLVAEACWYPLLSYIRTRCSYAVNTADLRSYVLRNLVGMHCCPTFVHAAYLPPLPLATFVGGARLPSTSSTCVRMRCRTSLVYTAVLHSYTLHVCRYCRWLHMYVLHVCRQHC